VVALMLPCAGAGIVAAPGPGVSIPVGRSTPPAGPILGDHPTRSDTCGSCHKEIHRLWSGSAHARALEDPVFLAAFRETVAREGDQVSRTCLACHAPLADLTNDPRLEAKLTWEGVSCDVCHSMIAVDLAGPTPKISFDVGAVKRGPISDAESTAHEVAFSELHTTSRGCAGCHEWSSRSGVPIMSTYSEWTQSSAAREGRPCQSCHMAKTRAKVVDPRVQRVPRAEVNLHDVPGGHSLEQLHKALAVRIVPHRAGNNLHLEVRLTNKGAGHAVPTGMPGRRVLLDLVVRTSEGEVGHEQRSYSRSYAGADGALLTRDAAHFSPGVRLVGDTRLAPDERRVESFTFPVPAEATAFVNLRLHYEHAPMGGAEFRTFITFFSEERTLLPGSGGDAAPPDSKGGGGGISP
jgi:hypothetical protein